MSMSDSITQLNRSMRLRRARWDKVPWCSVSIELKAVTRQDRCFVGIALIDRRQVGWLVKPAGKMATGHGHAGLLRVDAILRGRQPRCPFVSA
jgi:hypothetical protein